MTTKTCYLELYIEYILAVQKKFGNGIKLPLCIMTSGDTNAKTIALLQKHNYFGMDQNQVTIVQQGQGVPALLDNSARIAMESPDKWFKIQTKPHGHGDIHHLLHEHGVAKKWQAADIQWLTLFQDTNGLAFHTLPLMLGVSRKLNLVMNSLAVPRKAKQAVGGIVKLKNKKTGDFRYVRISHLCLVLLNACRILIQTNGDSCYDDKNSPHHFRSKVMTDNRIRAKLSIVEKQLFASLSHVLLRCIAVMLKPSGLLMLSTISWTLCCEPRAFQTATSMILKQVSPRSQVTSISSFFSWIHTLPYWSARKAICLNSSTQSTATRPRQYLRNQHVWSV